MSPYEQLAEVIDEGLNPVYDDDQVIVNVRALRGAIEFIKAQSCHCVLSAHPAWPDSCACCHALGRVNDRKIRR